MVDAIDSKSIIERCARSSRARGTKELLIVAHMDRKVPEMRGSLRIAPHGVSVLLLPDGGPDGGPVKHSSLSHMQIKNAPEGKFADGQGLWLIKREKTCGKWVQRIFVQGKRREMGLGAWPEVSIVEARKRASEARMALRGSVDPIEARKQSRRVVHRLTVKDAIDSCFQARKAQLKGDGEAGRWMSPLTVHVIPKLGTLAVEELDQHTLKELLAPLWHTKPEAAVKALNRLGLTLTHCAALGLNVDLQATLKARALLGKQRHVEEHIPSVAYQEAPAFYAWLIKQSGVPAKALRFLMLTIARTTEVRKATGGEIVGDAWTIPADRTKTGKEHRVPLVGEARKLTVPSGLLFPTVQGKALSDAGMSMLMRRAGYAARPHGFRATFRTWCEECTDADFETKEACLGHVVDAGVVGAYQRSDRFEKRKKLLGDWEAYLLG